MSCEVSQQKANLILPRRPSWISDRQKIQIHFKGSYEEHSYQATIPSTCGFREDDFQNSRQSEIIICPCSHVEFSNETKIMSNNEDYPGKNSIKFVVN